MTTETTTESWSDLKERIRGKWSNLTDHILEQGKDSKEKLVSVIQRMTGESRENITSYLDHGTEVATDLYGRASEAVKAGSEQVQEGVKYARESIECGTERAGKLVQARPVESLIATFAVGVVAGLALEMFFRSKPTTAQVLQSHFPSMNSLPSSQAMLQAYNKFMKDNFGV